MFHANEHNNALKAPNGKLFEKAQKSNANFIDFDYEC